MNGWPGRGVGTGELAEDGMTVDGLDWQKYWTVRPTLVVGHRSHM
jgi:hypothetical protein